MRIKIAAGVIAVVLMLAYLAPPALKLKDPALIVVTLFGVALMLIDLWQSMKSKDD